MLIRNHTEQEDVIRTTLYEPRGKSRYRVEETERMHSSLNYTSRQLGHPSRHLPQVRNKKSTTTKLASPHRFL